MEQSPEGGYLLREAPDRRLPPIDSIPFSTDIVVSSTQMTIRELLDACVIARPTYPKRQGMCYFITENRDGADIWEARRDEPEGDVNLRCEKTDHVLVNFPLQNRRAVATKAWYEEEGRNRPAVERGGMVTGSIEVDAIKPGQSEIPVCEERVALSPSFEVLIKKK